MSLTMPSEQFSIGRQDMYVTNQTTYSDVITYSPDDANTSGNSSALVPTSKQIFVAVLVELIAFIGIVEFMLMVAIFTMCCKLRNKVIITGVCVFQSVQMLHLLTCFVLLWLFIHGWNSASSGQKSADLCLLYSIVVGSHYAGLNYMALALLITAIFPNSSKRKRIFQGACIWTLSVVCGWSVGYMSPMDNACMATRAYDFTTFTAAFRISIPIACLSAAASATWLYWKNCFTATQQALSASSESSDDDNEDNNTALNQNNSNNTRCYLPLVELQHCHEEFSSIDGTIANPHIPNLNPNAYIIMQEFKRKMRLKRLMQCAPLVCCLLVLCCVPLYCQVFLVIRHSNYDNNIEQHEASLFITTIMFSISIACLMFWIWIYKFTKKACSLTLATNPGGPTPV